MSDQHEQFEIDEQMTQTNVPTGTPLKKTRKAKKMVSETQEEPRYKSIVQRCFHKREISNGVSKRVTIYYEYDRDNKVLKYGAVVVHLTKEMKGKNLKEFEDAAKKRFIRDPVIIRNFADNGSLTDFQESVRSLLFNFGCKGTKVTK